MGQAGPLPEAATGGLQMQTRSQDVGAAHEERDSEQGEREVGYFPRAEEAQYEAPTGKIRGPPAYRYVDRPLPGDTLDLASYRMIRGCFRPVTARNRLVMVDFNRRRPLSGDISLATAREEETRRKRKRENLRWRHPLMARRWLGFFFAVFFAKSQKTSGWHRG
ncbi:hypothetical protein BHM03_00017426 [Ensete ventricosum]|nr:hypothetical protein BHM03_00017426 [Ensete ventricosum]